VKLVEQESAFLSAHKEELQQALGQQPVQKNKAPSDIEKIVMPDNPEVWFDLLPYLQNQNVTKPSKTLYFRPWVAFFCLMDAFFFSKNCR
jgi:hypothetical protein